MSTVVKKLEIAIVVDPQQASAELKKLQEAFANAFNVNLTPLKELVSHLEKVASKIQEIQGLIKIAEKQSPIVKGDKIGIEKEIASAQKALADFGVEYDKIVKLMSSKTATSTKTASLSDIVKAEQAMKRLEKQAETVRLFLSRGGLTDVEKSIAEKQLLDVEKLLTTYRQVSNEAKKRLEKEFKLMSSYKTTPYPYEPIDRIKPFVEKQLPYKNEVERQLLEGLSTSEKIIRMTQDRLRNGLLMGAAEDVKAYVSQMLEIANQVSPRLRSQIASMFRDSGAMDIIKEYNAYMREVKRLADIIEVSPKMVKGWKLAIEDVKKLSQAMENLKDSIKTTGIEKVSRFYKDVISYTVVKGSGREIGMTLRESDVNTIYRLKKEIPELENVLAKLGIQASETHSRLGGLFASARNYMKFQMGWFLGAATIFSVVASIKQFVQIALEFDQTLKNIQAVTGATSAEINLLANAAKRIAVETPMAATEAAKLGLQLIRAGLDAKDAAAAMAVAAKVAVVSGEDVKVVADAIATAMMAWKLSAQDAERIGNTIAAAMNYSRLTVQDLGTAFNYLAGVAKSFNFSLEETTAILAVYSNMGVRASTIATGWTQLMSELISPSRKAQEYIRSLNNEAKGISITFADLSPLTHSFAEILQKLEQSGFAASKALDIFQVRAGRSLLFALNAGSEAFVKMEEKIRSSKQLTEGLARVKEGLSAQFKVLINRLQITAIEITDSLMPAFKALAAILNFIAGVFTSNARNLNRFFGDFGGYITIILSLAAAFKLLLRINLIASFNQTKDVLLALLNVIVAVTRGVTQLKEAWKALIVVMSRNPLGIVATVGSMMLGGWLVDKILGGNEEIEKIKETNSQVEHLSRSVYDLGISMGLTEEKMQDFVSAQQQMADNAKNAIQALGEYKVPDFKVIFKDLIVSSDEAFRVRLPSSVQHSLDSFIRMQAEINRIKDVIRNLKLELEKESSGEIRQKGFDTTMHKRFQLRLEESLLKTLKDEAQKHFDNVISGMMMSEKEVKRIFDLTKKLPPEKQLSEAYRIAGETAARTFVETYNNTFKALTEQKQKGQIKLTEEEIKNQSALLAMSSAQSQFQQIASGVMQLRDEVIRKSEQQREKMKREAEQTERDLKELRKLIDEGMLWGMEDAEITKIENKYKDFISRVEELHKKLPQNLREQYESEIEKLKAHLATMKPIEIDIVKLNLRDAEQSIREWRDIIGKIEEPVSNWESAFKNIADLVEKKISEIWLILEKMPEGHSERKKLIEEIIKLSDAVAEANNKIINSKLGLSRVFVEISEEIKQFYLDLLPSDAIERKLTEINNAFDDKIVGMLSKLQEKGFVDIQANILSMADAFKEVIKSGKELDEFFKIFKGTQVISDEDLKKIKEWVKAWKTALDIQKEIAQRTAPIKNRIQALESQKENQQIMLEINEAIGNWNGLENIKLRMLETEIEYRRKSLGLQIEEKQALIEMVEKSPGLAENLNINLAAEKEKVYLLMIQKAVYDQLADIQLKLASAPRWRRELTILVHDWLDIGKHLVNIATETARSMQQAFSDFFFDMFRGELKSLADYITSFLNSILRAISQALSQLAVSGIFQALRIPISFGINVPTTPNISTLPLGDFNPIYVGHEGGYVPYYHRGGLVGDEVLAILQRGEYVVSRRGVKALDRINEGEIFGGDTIININMENKTGLPLDLKHISTKTDEKTRTKTILMDLIWSDPSVRTALAGVR